MLEIHAIINNSGKFWCWNIYGSGNRPKLRISGGLIIINHLNAVAVYFLILRGLNIENSIFQVMEISEWGGLFMPIWNRFNNKYNHCR